jgi:hypothetical protein
MLFIFDRVWGRVFFISFHTSSYQLVQGHALAAFGHDLFKTGIYSWEKVQVYCADSALQQHGIAYEFQWESSVVGSNKLQWLSIKRRLIKIMPILFCQNFSLVINQTKIVLKFGKTKHLWRLFYGAANHDVF